MADRRKKQFRLLLLIAFECEVTQIRTIEAGDVFVGIVEAELVDDVVANALRRAGRKRCDASVRKISAQSLELAVFGAKLVAPF